MTKTRKTDVGRFVLLIGERRIRARVKQLAGRISRDYGGTVPVFVGILNGSFVFLADLIREISLDCELDFIRLSSYGGEAVRRTRVRELRALSGSLRGRHVLLVEDIIDSGRSLEHARRLLKRRGPRSIRVAALLAKSEAAAAEYIGFVIPKVFVVGYGLDYRGRLRNRKAVYYLKTAE